MGKALYRKYRPLSLQDVVGQDTVVKSLSNSLKQGKISHAYLFTGPRGCGKTSVARIFAHEINTFKYELEDNYVDIIEIDAASNTGVDNIRELREKAIIAPTMGKYKVYIIDEVHMLSKSAFNALLKILEEPPRHIVFIMATTNPEKVPVTITSRSLTYAFSLAPVATIKEHLKSIANQEKVKLTDDALAIIAERSGGSFRDAVSLLDQISTLSTGQITAQIIEQALGLPQAQLVQDILSAFAGGDATAITNQLQTAINAGVREEILVEELIRQIIADPRPEYLPLLAKLPSVTAPFITAKLLTTFLGEGDRPAFTIAQPAVQSAAQPIAQPTTTPQSTPNLAPIDFSWRSFLKAIQQNTTNGIYLNLRKCQYAVVDHTLHLYPNKIGQRILNSPANKKLIAEQLNGLQLEIHAADDTPPVSATITEPEQPNPSTVDQIFGIINETQEDSYAGEIPF